MGASGRRGGVSRNRSPTAFRQGRPRWWRPSCVRPTARARPMPCFSTWPARATQARGSRWTCWVSPSRASSPPRPGRGSSPLAAPPTGWRGARPAVLRVKRRSPKRDRRFPWKTGPRFRSWPKGSGPIHVREPFAPWRAGNRRLRRWAHPSCSSRGTSIVGTRVHSGRGKSCRIPWPASPGSRPAPRLRRPGRACRSSFPASDARRSRGSSTSRSPRHPLSRASGRNWPRRRRAIRHAFSAPRGREPARFSRPPRGAMVRDGLPLPSTSSFVRRRFSETAFLSPRRPPPVALRPTGPPTSWRKSATPVRCSVRRAGRITSRATSGGGGSNRI